MIATINTITYECMTGEQYKHAALIEVIWTKLEYTIHVDTSIILVALINLSQ